MNEEQRYAMAAAEGREVVIGERVRSVRGSGLWGWVNFWVFIGFVSVELQQNILSSLESAGRVCVCVLMFGCVCMWLSLSGQVGGRVLECGGGLNSHISYARRKSHKSLASSACTCERLCL